MQGSGDRSPIRECDIGSVGHLYAWGSEVQVGLTPAHLGEWGMDLGSSEELRDDHKRSELTMEGQGCLLLAQGCVRRLDRG